MSDIKQALRDFVATSNSGKYSTEDEILSKFPELQGYDRQLLRDFVATSNSGKYATEDEVFSKFPEFNDGVKKKDQFRFDLESGSRPIQPTSGSKTSQFKPQKFGEFAPLETKKEEDKIEFAGALPESEQKVLDILSQKPSLKFVEDEDLKAYIRQNPKAWTDELIKKNPSLKDQTIDGVLPGLMDEEPTIDNQSLKSIENANTLIDYTKSYDEAFDNMVKESDSFTDDDVKANPKKYRDAVMNDYLTYLKMVNGEDSQTYLDVKERLDYYNSLGDKLYNDSAYADDLKRYQDIQKQALAKVSNNSYSKSIAIENNYDWKYFSKKASNLDVKARNIEKQIAELGIEEGKALSVPQKKKYEDLMNQYNQVKQEFDKLSEETNITPEVIDQIRSQQGRMASVMNTIDFIDNDKSANAESIRQYKAEMEANKKAQEEFYNTKDNGNLAATGKGVTRLGQQAAKTFVNGIFDIAKMPAVVGEAFGAKGYGWSDKLSETAENINSMVELYNPELDRGNFSGFMNFMNDAGQGLGSIAQFATAGSGASKIAKGLDLSEKGLMVANRTAQFTAAASTSTAALYNELIDAGFTPEEASQYSLFGGVLMGSSEMLLPEDELIKNTIKQTFISSIKSGANPKEAAQNALSHLAKKTAQIASTSSKETIEEAVGSLAESTSKQVASTMTGKKIDGIWDLKNFNSDALAGGQTAFILEMFKFGPRRGKYSNPFEEDLVGYLAENYNDITETLANTHPEDYDKIADRYKKLKDIYEGLKNTPAFNKLSKTDQNHVLAQAHAKQVILENIKQSGLSKEGFQDEISSIDEDIFQTLNGLRSKDTWVDKSKKEENAVQKPSTEEVLPREQGATSETGGQPQGMGQSVQGQEVTQEGEKVSQEGVNRLNKETFAEDITPEQKAKVEEQNQKDEDEAIDEIYDFNDEVKSIGTKEQFKQFLRSLSPTAAFSRIAWHNTNKPTLEPREGQYYTNTRKNAEDTYKGENTFPAIVFGNAPKKATFDEVQDVNTEALKGEGADVVVTDDLSPAIGAEMNYREFVPTSADQIIPIGTKENIDAFKAFVEQQKTSEEAKPATEEKVQPEAQELTSEKLSDEDKKSIDSISKDLEEYLKNNPEEYLPGEKKDGKVVVKVKGGLLDIRNAALNSDKRKSIPTPTSLPFLPKIINLRHLARNSSDKKSILKNGFDENQVNLDSPIPGIYFSSDDWSTMGRFDRSTKDSLFASIENEGLIYFDSAKEFEDFLKENNLPSTDRRRLLTKDQVDFLRSKGIKGILLREDYASGSRNELIVIDKSIIKDVSESEKEITDVPSSFVEPKSISKAYYLAKKNNSNPELVEAVEKAIGERSVTTKEEAKPTEEAPVEETKPTEEKEPEPEEQAKMEEEVAKSEAVSPKNVRELIGVYRKVFNLPYHKAFVSAMVSNRLIKQMAKRAGITTEQMYQRLQFKKASEKDLPKGVKMQVDAWHGSPYEFDKFTTEKMGSGEGVQAFGWGLYFTDLKDIGESYANKLSKNKVKIPSKYLDALNRRWSSKRSLSEALNIDDGDFSKKIIKVGLENAITDTQILIEKFEREVGADPNSALYKSAKEDLEILKELLEKGIDTEKQRNLYKVSLHKGKTPEQYTWLEWDKKIPKAIEDNLNTAINNSFEFTSSEKENLIPISSFDSASGLYNRISNFLGQKEASLFLLENGIDGVKYPAESLSRGRTSETARGFNYVVFDENAVSIEEVIKFQKDANTARGAMMIGLDGQAIIYALTDANASTPLHELAHVFEHYLTKEEKAKIIKAAKTTRWTRQTSEYFARGFEKYLAEGKSSDPIFEKFKQFLLDIYKAIKGSPIDVKLNKDMKAIYATMLGEDLTEDLGETLDENIESSSSKEEEMAKSAVEELMTAKKKRGAKKIDEMKNVKEKYGQMGKKLDYIDRNFDKLIDKLGIVKSCWLE